MLRVIVSRSCWTSTVARGGQLEHVLRRCDRHGLGRGGAGSQQTAQAAIHLTLFKSAILGKEKRPARAAAQGRWLRGAVSAPWDGASGIMRSPAGDPADCATAEPATIAGAPAAATGRARPASGAGRRRRRAQLAARCATAHRQQARAARPMPASPKRQPATTTGHKLGFHGGKL